MIFLFKNNFFLKTCQKRTREKNVFLERFIYDYKKCQTIDEKFVYCISNSPSTICIQFYLFASIPFRKFINEQLACLPVDKFSVPIIPSPLSFSTLLDFSSRLQNLYVLMLVRGNVVYSIQSVKNREHNLLKGWIILSAFSRRWTLLRSWAVLDSGLYEPSNRDVCFRQYWANSSGCKDTKLNCWKWIYLYIQKELWPVVYLLSNTINIFLLIYMIINICNTPCFGIIFYNLNNFDFVH